jgi:hypothetical protein
MVSLEDVQAAVVSVIATFDDRVDSPIELGRAELKSGGTVATVAIGFRSPVRETARLQSLEFVLAEYTSREEVAQRIRGAIENILAG